MVLIENDSESFETEPTKKRGRGRPPKESNNDNVNPDADSAPKRPNQKAPTNKNWSKAVEVEKALNTYLNTIGAGVSFVNENDGVAILNGSETLASELVELARNDRTYRTYLEWFTKPGKYGGVLIASGAIVIPILANHNLLPQLKIPFGNTNTEDKKEGENLT